MALPKKVSKSPVMAGGCESVRIEKAGNGYTVSKYTEKGELKMVAKNEKEAMAHCKAMLNK